MAQTQTPMTPDEARDFDRSSLIVGLDGTRVGIPYAYVDLTTGARTCPVCQLVIAEDHDRDGEQTSDNYAEHYMAEHNTHVDPTPEEQTPMTSQTPTSARKAAQNKARADVARIRKVVDAINVDDATYDGLNEARVEALDVATAATAAGSPTLHAQAMEIVARVDQMIATVTDRDATPVVPADDPVRARALDRHAEQTAAAAAAATRRADVDARRTARTERDARILEALKAGKSEHEVAKAEGISRSAVWSVKKKAGLVTASASTTAIPDDVVDAVSAQVQILMDEHDLSVAQVIRILRAR